MVVQVGDKVLVYGAGTPWAFAKKIEPVQVGDKVDVVTLSDGTKLAMPRIDLNLDDYVWVIPTWGNPAFPIDMPFSWGTIPLGAAVFTLSSIENCFQVKDTDREWGDLDLAGCLMIILSGQNKRGIYKIAGFSNNIYTLSGVELPEIDYLDWTLTRSNYRTTLNSYSLDSLSGYFYNDSSTVYSSYVQIVSPDLTCTGVRAVLIPYKFVSTKSPFYCECNLYSRKFDSSGNYPQYLLSRSAVLASSKFNSSECAALGISLTDRINPKYPDYDLAIIDTDSAVHTGTIRIKGLSLNYNLVSKLWFGQLSFIPSDCITDGLAAGDKYIIYNPVTKKLVFNDASKTIFAAASWRDINYPGEVVTHTPVTYLWDGQGQVYLSQSKTTNSTIFYDNELRVEAFGDTGDVRAIDYHTNDEYTYSGETVSRELVNITRILRAGKNYVQLKARDTGGTKVGFPTPIYIKRDMS